MDESDQSGNEPDPLGYRRRFPLVGNQDREDGLRDVGQCIAPFAGMDASVFL